MHIMVEDVHIIGAKCHWWQHDDVIISTGSLEDVPESARRGHEYDPGAGPLGGTKM